MMCTDCEEVTKVRVWLVQVTAIVVNCAASELWRKQRQGMEQRQGMDGWREGGFLR